MTHTKNENALLLAMMYNQSGATATLKIEAATIEMAIQNLHIERSPTTLDEYIVLTAKVKGDTDE